MKLSRTQQELYDLLKSGKVVRYSPYWQNTPARYFVSGTLINCTAAAKKLLALGLVEKYDKNIRGNHSLRLVDAAPEVTP